MSEILTQNRAYARQRANARRGIKGRTIDCGRRVTTYDDGEYQVNVLELKLDGKPSEFSARLIAPPDERTPYAWIKAWINTPTWAEALIAGALLAERVSANQPLGEYELIRQSSQ